jgi:hypothetical protein
VHIFCGCISFIASVLFMDLLSMKKGDPMKKNPLREQISGAPGFLPLLTEREAARFLSISPTTLTSWRSLGRYGLAFIKVGRKIRYEPSALRDFIEKRRMTRTGPKASARRANPKKTT